MAQPVKGKHDRPRIAVDAMGGDTGPTSAIPAAAQFGDVAEIVLVGDEATLQQHCAGQRAGQRLRIVHAEQTLSPADSLTSLNRKSDSSLYKALTLITQGEVDAVVSAADTAQILVLARQRVGMVAGVHRPAIAKAMQGVGGEFWMLDLGAILDCDADSLTQFAIMGSVVARSLGGIAQPRVALLNIGTEADKGPRVLALAAERLRSEASIDYVGFIEGSRLFEGDADVVVCDGFAGNIALKSAEGAASMANHLLRRAVRDLNPLQRTGLWLLRNALREVQHQINPQRHNGASLLGLKGVVIKSHGAADSVGFESAIREAVKQVQGRIPVLLEGISESQTS